MDSDIYAKLHVRKARRSRDRFARTGHTVLTTKTFNFFKYAIKVRITLEVPEGNTRHDDLYEIM